MKKKLIILSAVAMSTAAAVPALAFENEFHGMYRAFGYVTNNYSKNLPATDPKAVAVTVDTSTTPPGVNVTATGDTTTASLNAPAGLTTGLSNHSRTSSYVEQRARLQYIAKASDDLKLVTHFELDALFGGGTASKYQGNDAGGLDTDQVTLETKNVYIDFNSTFAPVNVKVGLQPFNDAYQGVFGNFDGAGALVTGKFGIVTPQAGWFRVSEDTATYGKTFYPGKRSNDLLIVGGRVAPTKDVSLGGNYYYLNRDSNAVSATVPSAVSVHTLGADVAAKVGPATLAAFGAYQFGDFTDNATSSRNLSAYALGAVAKINLGAANLNLSGLYLSGENGKTGEDDYNGWQQLAPTGQVSYFNASNMWILIRNGASINTSTSLVASADSPNDDLTKGGRGLIGAFAGVDATIGKVIVATNVGYAQVAEKRAGEKGTIGTEVNATVGYKLYDNFTASLNGAYAFLGDGMGGSNTSWLLPMGCKDAKDPYVTFVRLDYTF